MVGQQVLGRSSVTSKSRDPSRRGPGYPTCTPATGMDIVTTARWVDQTELGAKADFVD